MVSLPSPSEGPHTRSLSVMPILVHLRMVATRRIFRFLLLVAFIAWFIWEIVHFPIRVELKAILILGAGILLYISVGELRGLSRKL